MHEIPRVQAPRSTARSVFMPLEHVLLQVPETGPTRLHRGEFEQLDDGRDDVFDCVFLIWGLRGTGVV
jgi:hypothetical protein